MQSLTFERTNGNIPRKLAGEDHISGIMFYTDTLPSGFSETERIKAISQIETAEKLGITAELDEWIIRLMHYQLSEIFRLNPGISLYVGIFPKAEGANTYADVKKMQNFAGGRLRQLGIWEGDVAFSKENLTALQGVAATLEGQDMPLSILYAPKVAAVASLPTDAAGDKERVSSSSARPGAPRARRSMRTKTMRRRKPLSRGWASCSASSPAPPCRNPPRGSRSSPRASTSLPSETARCSRPSTAPWSNRSIRPATCSS